ncbi:hypothetical protein [uncultured Draconibacterium sp.]|uniref:hypothetical protein n=1 Tax=uncultured Draconibacterium sp. TaxID=1573823 RepID=UPI003260871B
MQEIKKQLEVLLVNYFRKCYSDFPKGRITASESPDFLVKLKNKQRIGIELTRLNPANAVEISAADKAKNTFHEELVDSMREHFEFGNDRKLFVKFLFNQHNGINPASELVIRSQTVSLIRSAIENRGRQPFFNQTLNGGNLPQGIKQIMIAGHSGLEASVWERSNNLGISTNVVDDIRKAIAKKDEKLRLYQKQKLDKYWLLITTDCLRADKNINLLNKIQREEFSSLFHKVFLFDLMRARVLELV